MNVHASNHKSTVETPQRSDSLDTLRQWLYDGAKRRLTDEELVAIKILLPKIENYPDFETEYPHDFKVTEDYAARMPDLQNGPAAMIDLHRRWRNCSLRPLEPRRTRKNVRWTTDQSI